MAFSPDGKTLASGSADYTVILWDTETGQPLSQPLTGHSYWVNSVAFSPDGKTVASGGVDTNVFLWDTETGQLFRQLQVGPGIVYNLAFSPDGRILAFPKLETIILWDTETGQPLGQPLTGHTSSVNSVAFSPDRKTLASGSFDGTIILWNLDLEWWKARACRIANRNMTAEEWKQYMGDESYRLTCPNLPPHPSIIEQK